jgi:Flp pilus assembly protein TadG
MTKRGPATPVRPRMLRRPRILRGWVPDARGSAAVEFAMLGLPFFAILGVVFQAGLHILTQQSLDDAVDRAARALFTGEFQTGADGTPATDRMRSFMCRSLWFVGCTGLKLDVTSSATFASASQTQPYDDMAKNWNTAFGKTFTCPTGDAVVSITAAVPAPLYFSLLMPSGQAMPGGRQLLVSTAIFRSEPYPAGSC